MSDSLEIHHKGARPKDIDSAEIELTRLRAENEKLRARSVLIPESVQKIIDDYPAVCAERDRMREALRPFDDFPLHKWDGIGDDHVLYGPFTLGHVRKYLSGSCQGLLDNSNYPEKPDSCARAELEGVTKPASPWRDIESAPRNGIVFLAINNRVGPNPRPKGYNPYFMCYCLPPDEGVTYASDAGWHTPGRDWPCYPTHWMPLPEPPR